MLFAALAVLALSAPAAAEPLRLAQAGAPGFLAPRQVIAIVRSTGFDPLDRPMRRGPHYLVRAIDNRDREVTVVVSGLSGEIVSVTPATMGSQMPPRGAVGRYERTPPGYGPPPGSRSVYSAGEPVAGDDPSSVYAPRPPAPVPGALPRSNTASMPPGSANDDDEDSLPPAPSSPRVITSTAPDQYRGQNGVLPPPPERFPKRAAMPSQVQPPANPKPPVKRAALPKQTPLPKPKPQAETKAEAVPPPPVEQALPSAAPEDKSAKNEVAAPSPPPQPVEKTPPPLPAEGGRGPADAVPN
jgi:formin 2